MRARVFLVFATLVGTCVGVAQARPSRPVRLGQVASAVVADDSRYAVYTADDGATRVIDAWARKTRTLRPGSQCTLVGVGGGYVLWSCRRADGYYVPLLYRIAAHGFAPTADVSLPPYSDIDGSSSFAGVGSHWLSIVGATGSGSGHPGFAGTSYVDWHNGATDAGDLGAAQVPDLDAAGLSRVLCRPLARVRNRDDRDRDAYRPYAYRRPLGLFQQGNGEFVDPSLTPLLLQRCGEGKRRTLAKCAGGCYWPTMSSTAAGWSQEFPFRGLYEARVYLIKRRQYKTWSFHRPIERIGLTRDDLFVTIRRDVSSTEAPKLAAYRIRLP